MKHPPFDSEIERLYTGMIYGDILMTYPIRDVVRYWTKLLIDNGIRLDKLYTDENGWDGDFHRIHHKTFPWAVDIIHMYSERLPDLYKKDCYKICFNLEDGDILTECFVEDSLIITENNGVAISRRSTGILGHKLTEKEKEYISNLFKGNWLNYLDIQGYRIIVQFWLEDYYPIFRKEKILHIKKKLLTL